MIIVTLSTRQVRQTMPAEHSASCEKYMDGSASTEISGQRHQHEFWQDEASEKLREVACDHNPGQEVSSRQVYGGLQHSMS